jgi:hypothetical protein
MTGILYGIRADGLVDLASPKQFDALASRD